MRLGHEPGPIVELDIVDYEQPMLGVGDAGGGEANGDDEGPDWLIVRGLITQSGRSWTFSDACLDTDDAARLGAWLADIADGAVGSRVPQAAIGFPEPELVLELSSHADGRAVIRFSLLGEAAPPWSSVQEHGNGYLVEVAASHAELRAAADAWRRQLERYPDR